MRLALGLNCNIFMSQDMDQVGALLELELPTDTMAAKQSLLNLSEGSPPRSHRETHPGPSAHAGKKRQLDTAISWVRAHIGITGNERAGREATYVYTAAEGGI